VGVSRNEKTRSANGISSTCSDSLTNIRMAKNADVT